MATLTEDEIKLVLSLLVRPELVKGGGAARYCWYHGGCACWFFCRHPNGYCEWEYERVIERRRVLIATARRIRDGKHTKVEGEPFRLFVPTRGWFFRRWVEVPVTEDGPWLDALRVAVNEMLTERADFLVPPKDRAVVGSSVGSTAGAISLLESRVDSIGSEGGDKLTPTTGAKDA